MEGEQSGGVAHRRRAKHEAAHHGEDGGVGADTQADREHRNGRRAAVLAERSNRIAQVPQQILQPGQRPPLAISLPRLLRSAQANQRLPPRFVTAQSSAHPVLRMHRHMALDLRGKIILCFPRARHSPQPHPQRSQPTHRKPHHASAAGVTKRARISVVCSHSATALRIRFCPALVSS